MQGQTKPDARTPLQKRVRPSCRYRFFGGKGGVGKTTCAAAFAIAEAHRGEQVLIVSTDPAHSLGDALGLKLSNAEREVHTGKGRLVAVELDAKRSLKRWLARRKEMLAVIAERGTYLRRDDVDQLLELTLPGVDELVGLIEVGRLAARRRYGRVVIDAAPTGHLLRLLEMPITLEQLAAVFDRMQDKHRFLSLSLAHRYRADESDAVIEDLKATASELRRLLADEERCRFSWVLLAEPMSLAETEDGVRALGQSGIHMDQIIVNRLLADRGAACASCQQRGAAEQAMLAAIRTKFPRSRISLLHEQEQAPVGVDALLAIERSLEHSRLPQSRRTTDRRERPGPTAKIKSSQSVAWLEVLAPAARRLLLFGGKGGVGKTTCATAAALWLARRAPERRVLLLSTDPAHSVGDCLGTAVGDAAVGVAGAPPNLRVRELDAATAFAGQRERYQRAIDELFRTATRRAGLDLKFDREIVQDLVAIAPPGLDELVSMLAITEALLEKKGARGAAYDIVVVDMAPTGHALRLLEMPAVARQWVHALLGILLDYRRAFGLGELAATLVDLARDLAGLGSLLGDARRSGFVATVRAERLARLETARLIKRLHELRIPLAAVLTNAATSPDCRRCRSRARAETAELAALASANRPHLGRNCAMIVTPAVFPPPRGVRALLSWGQTWKVVSQ